MKKNKILAVISLFAISSCLHRQLPKANIDAVSDSYLNTSVQTMSQNLSNCQVNNKRFFNEYGSSYLLSLGKQSVYIIGRKDWQARPVVKESNRYWVAYQNKPICLSIRRITVHHTHSLYSIKELQIFHQNIDDPKADIAYHFYIDQSGLIYEGRPLGYIGSHSERDNAYNVGIVLNGDFENSIPAQTQINALYQLLNALQCDCSVLEGIWTHRQRKGFKFPGNSKKSTLCPGKKLNQIVMDYVKENQLTPVIHHRDLNNAFD